MDMRWVMCLYKWPWALHSCGWSLYEWQTTRKHKPGLVLVSMWTQSNPSTTNICTLSTNDIKCVILYYSLLQFRGNAVPAVFSKGERCSFTSGRPGWGTLIVMKTLYLFVTISCHIFLKIVTRCQILWLKYTIFNFTWGSTPNSAGGAYNVPQTL